MGISDFGRWTITCAAVAMVAGCGVRAASDTVPPVSGFTNALKYHQTFSYTGNRQTFRVPDGVTTIRIAAFGASGGSSSGSHGSKVNGGYGGVVKATIPVSQGEHLAVFVGGQGGNGATGRGVAGSTAARPVRPAPAAAEAVVAAVAPRTCAGQIMD